MVAALLALVLAQTAADAGEAAPQPAPVVEPMPAGTIASPNGEPSVASGPPPLRPAPPGTHFHGALEAEAISFPSGVEGGAQDLFVNGTPLIGFDGGDDFGFELGAKLRLRAFDDPPAQRDGDIGKVIRRADWDETSDFGQILRQLRIGREDSGFSIRAGPLEGYTLGRGHLINRYSNRENPDYHPSGATMQFVIGPTRTEVMASDFLGARIFAGEVSADLGRILGDDASAYDRYHASISIAHDSGAAGYRAPVASLMHFDGDFAFARQEHFRSFGYAGLGSRLDPPTGLADLGALIGASMDGEPPGFQLGGRLEVRKQYGYFRHDFFGPQYEISRFAASGFSGTPIASEPLPDGFSAYGEFALATGPVDPGPNGAGRLVFSVAAEYFTWGRGDADAAVSLRTPGAKATLTARASVSGFGKVPRYAASGEVRWRFAPAFYAIGSAGTVFFPQPDSTLVRGFYAGGGIGADFER